MIKVEENETIRRAYFIEGKSIRQISREHGHCRRTVRKVIQAAGPRSYYLFDSHYPGQDLRLQCPSGARERRGEERRGVCLPQLHDACRVNDDVDPGHGKRGAELATRYRGRYFGLPERKFDLLCYACEAHTDGLTEADTMVQVCWDANRLNLPRAGISTKLDKLCAATARDS